MSDLTRAVLELLADPDAIHETQTRLEFGIIAQRTGGADAALAVLRASDPLAELHAQTAHVPDRVWWSAVRVTWWFHSLPWYGRDQWLALWTDEQRAPGRHLLMTELEQRLLAERPAVLPVFRGFTGDENDWRGLSWAPFRPMAERLARERHAHGPGVGLPMRIAAGTVARDRVLALMCGDRTIELVADPAHIENVTVGQNSPQRGGADRRTVRGDKSRLPPRPLATARGRGTERIARCSS